MSVFNIIKERRTIHNYVQSDISKDILHKAFEAANMAPNHKLTFPWRFTVAGPKVREQITNLAVEVKKQKMQVSEVKEQALRSKFNSATYLIAVQMLRSDNAFQAREDYASVSCAIQNMSLYLWSEGIGTKWSTGAVTTDDRTYELFGIDKKQKEIVGFLWVGKYQHVPPAPKRPDVADLYNFTE